MESKTTLRADQLEFREITRDCSDATKQMLLDKEAVHPLANEAELVQNRLAPRPHRPMEWDKHCYGLFAPGRNVPEVAVYVTLLHLESDAQGVIPNDRLPGNLPTLLNTPGAAIENANTAIFYTITNAALGPDGTPTENHPVKVQRGPQDETAGELLIGKIAESLAAQGITCFSTASPLRKGTEERAKGFRQWLEEKLHKGDKLLTPLEKEALAGIASSPLEELGKLELSPNTLLPAEKTFVRRLFKDLAVHYLVDSQAKNGKVTGDDVANFHLSNGAEIANIHLPEDLDAMTVSDAHGAFGMSVNYRYVPEHREANKAAYKAGKVALAPELAKRHAERMDNLSLPSRMAEAPAISRGTIIEASTPQVDR